MGLQEINPGCDVPDQGKGKCEVTLVGKASLGCLVNTEISALLAVMRRNVQWGNHFMSVDSPPELYLIDSLKTVRKRVFSWKIQWHDMNPILYLQPFLDIIRSGEIGTPVTSVALSSLYKILTLDAFDLNTVNIQDVMHSIVDAVTNCHFGVTDPASEEVVLMKILQVLLASVRCRACVVLNNQHICSIVDNCFQVIQQSGTKSELLQRIARHSMHELVRSIFSHLSEVDVTYHALANGGNTINDELRKLESDSNFIAIPSGTRNDSPECGELSSINAGSSSAHLVGVPVDGPATVDAKGEDDTLHDAHIMQRPFGAPCMIEIFRFLCSLLNVAEHEGMDSKFNSLAFDEDVPLFALGLINSAIELSGSSFHKHPMFSKLIQEDLFCCLLKFGLSVSPLILSMVCSIVLNLYHHLRTELKLQLEAFFSSVILRLAKPTYGASYQQQEVAMEALVDFCRQETFMMEMYANFDCDITSRNIFEELLNLLSENAIPVNYPLSSMHILSLEGLTAVIQGMAKRIGHEFLSLNVASINLEEYKPFWLAKCYNYEEPSHWIPFVRQRKHIKQQLMAGADCFNHDPKKGLEFLQRMHLLPEKLDAPSVAFFLRYTAGLDKSLVGDFLGNHDQFCVQVLHEFARTFDFEGLNLDTALRIFLETFKLPGESQKIQRALEAFSERYYEQSPLILANKDAALLLSYSLVLLNTDLHNTQVKKKMTEEDFIRNNRRINDGKDLPRDLLSQLYQSILESEICITPHEGSSVPEMTMSRWIDLIQKSRKTSPYIVMDYKPYLDSGMFSIIAGPTVTAVSVVFDHTEDENVFQLCIDGFLAAAKVAACLHLESVLDDLIISLCKFTPLLNSSYLEEFVLAYNDDVKARMATTTVFIIANKYGDCIRVGWRNILDCILLFYELGLLPAGIVGDTAGYPAEPGLVKPLSDQLSCPYLPAKVASKKFSGLMGRFSQLFSFDMEEQSSQPSEEELAAKQCVLETVQKCQINNIFTESKFLQADSLLHLLRAIKDAGKRQVEAGHLVDEVTTVFCLELVIAITLYNRDRILLLWHDVYEHLSNIIQSTGMPSVLVERAVFGLLKICHQLLPYKEDLVDELLKSLQLVLKLDARLADAYCEQITHEVGRLVKANANHIKSPMGWRVVLSLLAITARHPEASEAGFDALSFIMSEESLLLPSNFVFCIDAARQFAESRVVEVERSLHALDLMSGSATCLVRWALETKQCMEEDAAARLYHDVGEMWLGLVHALKNLCLDNREEVRNHTLLSFQKCLSGVQEIQLSHSLWLQCFDDVIFPTLDELLEIAQGQSPKNYRNMEFTLLFAVKLLSKVFLLSINETRPSAFSNLWMAVLRRMGNYMRVKIRGKRCEKLLELIPELLKNTLLVMKTAGLFSTGSGLDRDSLWELTWSSVNEIAPSLQADLFLDADSDKGQHDQGKKGAMETSPGAVSLPIELTSEIAVSAPIELASES